LLEYLDHIDQDLLLFFNGLNSPFWDQVMWWMSEQLIWLPLYLVIAGWLIYKFKWKAVIILILVALLITLSDQGSVHLFKEVFKRPRPCHDPDISGMVHLVRNHCGGEYGFVSSHAANTFAMAAFTLLIIRKRWYSIFIILWATLVSYSRIYMGVHYPGDVIGGAILGFLLGFFIYRLYILIEKKIPPHALHKA